MIIVDSWFDDPSWCLTLLLHHVHQINEVQYGNEEKEYKNGVNLNKKHRQVYKRTKKPELSHMWPP